MNHPNQFKHVALIGKYQASGHSGMRETLLEVAHFLGSLGLDVAFERDSSSSLSPHELGSSKLLSLDQIGQQCDLAIVVGGDGTMLA